MPSPLAHIASGVLIYRGVTGKLRIRERLGLFLTALVCALLPDLDALPGLWLGHMGNWHNQASHSLLLCLPVGLVAYLMARAFKADHPRRWPLAAVMGVTAHVFMDWATVGRGVMLFWPLTTERFQSPIVLFYGLRWSEGLWSPLHLITLANELALIALVVLWFRWRRTSRE